MVHQLWHECIYRNLISQIQETGQIFINVYSICTLKMTNFVQIL